MHTERRVYRRTQVRRQVEIWPLGGPHSSPKWLGAAGPSPLTNAAATSTIASGRMVDVGCGGMGGMVDQTLEIGAPCEVHIHGAEGKEQETRGEVRDFQRREDNNRVGISFDAPLLVLGDTARRGPKVTDDRAIKPLVLVVDDDPGVRALLDRFLSQRGLRVFPAADADEALEAIKNERPSLMILDLKLPEVTGLRLLELLRYTGIEVPNIWAMSGYVSDEDARAALELGATEFFNKPFDLDHVDYTLSLLAPLL